jgi:Fur family ferric uptake transcriptional regulator
MQEKNACNSCGADGTGYDDPEMVTTSAPDVSELKEQLRACGLRATSARIRVLRCLMDAEGPLSHADVFERVADAGLDRATVYRNLVDLAESGLARRYDLGDHTWRFELAAEADDHRADAHPHFVCYECGTIECLPTGAVAVKPMRGAPEALGQSELEVHVRGRCDDCT